MGRAYPGFGQTAPGSVDSLKQADSVKHIQQRDLIDVYHWVTGKSSSTTRDEGKFHNAPFPAAGYTLQTGFAVVLSDNLAFYTGDSLSKTSDIATNITYSQYNQIIAPMIADIWTKGNKYNIIADWRYMKYPSTTFGLGGHTQYSDGYTIDFSYIKLHTSILKNVAKNLYAGLGFYYDYFWNIREVNPPTGVVTSFQKYGLTRTETAVGPAVRAVFDSRINPVNPYNGWYASVVFHPSFEWLGSDADNTTMQIDIRKYFALRKDDRNILAIWTFNWLTMGEKTPYLLLPSTGWDDLFNTGRGYIQGRYRGNDMTYLEVEDRITISRNGLFGIVLFANAESFKRNLASRYNAIAPGYGGGIRLKLNKHSGANICIDYGVGLDGSQGFAVNLGEVF
jgi:hypothetical protein